MPGTHVFYQRGALEAVRVKQGFSWTAFFFGSMWALLRRAWPLFGAMFVAEGALWFAQGVALAHKADGMLLGLFVVNLSYAVVRGKFASRWLAWSLGRRGFSVVP